MDNPNDTESSPALWNPNSAANWSLIFTPAFGALIHAKNAEKLGRVGEAKVNRNFFYFSIGYTIFGWVMSFISNLPPMIFGLGSLVLLLTWYLVLAKKQMTFVKTDLGNVYRRRSWKQPLLIGFGCLAGYYAVTFVVAVLVNLVSGQNGG